MVLILKSKMESLLFTINKKEGLKLRFNPSFFYTFLAYNTNMHKILKYCKSKPIYIILAVLLQFLTLFFLVSYFSQRFFIVYYILLCKRKWRVNCDARDVGSKETEEHTLILLNRHDHITSPQIFLL